MKNRFIMLVIFFTFLVGCSLQKTTPAIETYFISPPSATGNTGTAGTGTQIIQLAVADTSRVFASTNISYQDQQQGFNSYAYSRWSDSPVNLLNYYFQQVLEQSQYFSAVIPPGSLSDTDLVLESTLYDFSHHIKDDDHSTANVSLQFYLIDARSKKVIATTLIDSEVASEPNAESAVLGLKQAVNNIADKLLVWLDKELLKLTDK
jgi:cholesterol transport system auxiliary component